MAFTNVDRRRDKFDPNNNYIVLNGESLSFINLYPCCADSTLFTRFPTALALCPASRNCVCTRSTKTQRQENWRNSRPTLTRKALPWSPSPTRSTSRWRRTVSFKEPSNRRARFPSTPPTARLDDSKALSLPEWGRPHNLHVFRNQGLATRERERPKENSYISKRCIRSSSTAVAVWACMHTQP